MKIPVTIYTTPNCPQCMMTARKMDTLGIVYDKVDLTQHPDLIERFKVMGHMSAPIVVTDRKTWSGFRLEKIESLGKFLHMDQAKEI
jgi:glutaredoxin-like protein NrdH